jgi:hypothetical protein
MTTAAAILDAGHHLIGRVLVDKDAKESAGTDIWK